MTAKISICVPTYNGGKYLRESLDDILSQSVGDFEVIIVDDDSTDDTIDVINSYAARDQRVRLYRNSQNLGLVGNWNRCFDLAQGEWIKFVFQDDRVSPRCLEILLEGARLDVPLIACQRSFIYENATVETRSSYERILNEQSLLSLFPEAGFVSSYDFCRAALERPGMNFIGEPTAVMLHRSVRERFGGFSPKFVQLCDFEYWARIACHVGLIVVPEVLASFRVHSKSKTAANNEEREFRTEVLDPFLLKYEFAYGPSFAPMRSVARKLGINLQRLLAVSAEKVQLQAQRRAKDTLLPDLSSVAEWNSVVAAHPKLTDSLYAVLHQFNRELDRHLLWRFRNNALRFKSPDTRCPIILCLDVEPDDLSGRHEPVTWMGFEIAAELFSTVRPLLASASGSAVHYTWMLRTDPQIALLCDSSSWLGRYYAAKMQQYSQEGDELGIIARAHRWDEDIKDWIADHDDQAWIDECLRSSFAAFQAAIGTKCESFRFGSGWLSPQSMSTLEELGACFDLTLQKGRSPLTPAYPGQRVTGAAAELTDLPSLPYKPSPGDFLKPDFSSRPGLWLIPLSAAIESEAPIEWGGAVRYRAFNLETSPDEFEWLMNKVLTTFDRPYLALTVSSSAAAQPRLLRNVKMNFSSLIMHPLADRFVFTTPREALGMLGCYV